MEQLNCLRCAYRHEDNGNCMAAGGFCTAVPAAYCPMLQKYLDTGLTPSDVHSLWGEWDAMMSVLNSIGGGYDRLRQLAEADKAGHLVVLPCKVGDTVYTLLRTFDGADVVGEAELWWTDIPQLGKTVFLTREEAEKALEAMKDE